MTKRVKYFDDDELLAYVETPVPEDAVAALASLRGLIAERDAAIAEIETARSRVTELETELEELDAAEAVLETVRYWFHDVLILHKPMTPPRRILAIVERAMGL
jgi:hypothetical protein